MKKAKGFKKDDDSYVGFETIIKRGQKTKTGRMHPEVGALRKNLLLKDLKIFARTQGHPFYRGYYKGELDVYPEKAFAHLPEGKDSCIGMHCIAIDKETRVALPVDKKTLGEEIKGKKNERPCPFMVFIDENDEVEEILVDTTQLTKPTKNEAT